MRCDEGKGFDAKEMSNNLGLGIGSMQGGARLLGGEFEIHSERGKGTRIEVWVPLPSGADHVKN
jgi:signal transduction histidine kinase